MRYDWLHMADPLHESLTWLKNNRRFPRSPFVFVNEKNGKGFGQPFSRRPGFIPGLCKKAKVRKFGFHALRRYVASELIRTPGVSLKDVQDVLRHSAIASTERYIKNIGEKKGGSVLKKL